MLLNVGQSYKIPMKHIDAFGCKITFWESSIIALQSTAFTDIELNFTAIDKKNTL